MGTRNCLSGKDKQDLWKEGGDLQDLWKEGGDLQDLWKEGGDLQDLWKEGGGFARPMERRGEGGEGGDLQGRPLPLQAVHNTKQSGNREGSMAEWE